MRAHNVALVDHAVVVPTPEALLPQVVGYALNSVSPRAICPESTCLVGPPEMGNWYPAITHTAGCPTAWLEAYAKTEQHPFKTDQGFLDALLSHLAVNDNFCTHDACGGVVGQHVPDCLARMVEPYLGWVKQAGAP